MLEARQYDDLSEFLQSCVNSIKADFPRFSSSQIAKRLGIPNSTFDRISKREVKSPSFAHALKIVRSTMQDNDIQGFIEKFYPDFSKDYDNAYTASRNSTFVSPGQESLFANAATYEIMMLASSPNGVTFEEVKENYGSNGVKALEKIIENDGLTLENGSYRISETVRLEQPITKILASHLINNNYESSKHGTKQNYLAIMWERVDKAKVQPLLHQLNVDYHTKVWNLLSASENQGNDLIWAVVSTDSFDNNQQVLQ